MNPIRLTGQLIRTVAGPDKRSKCDRGETLASVGGCHGGAIMEHAGLRPKGEALKPLTFRERKFVDAYFRTTPIFNGAAAARAIGSSETSCRVQAVRLLIKDNIRAEIQARTGEYQQETQMTRTEWLRKVRRLYDAEVRKLWEIASCDFVSRGDKALHPVVEPVDRQLLLYADLCCNLANHLSGPEDSIHVLC